MHLMCGGLFSDNPIANFPKMRLCKSFENGQYVGEVTTKTLWCIIFFDSRCIFFSY